MLEETYEAGLRRAKEIGEDTADLFIKDEAFRENCAYQTDPQMATEADPEDRLQPLAGHRVERIVSAANDVGFIRFLPHKPGTADSPRWNMYSRMFYYERWLQNIERLVQGRYVDPGHISW